MDCENTSGDEHGEENNTFEDLLKNQAFLSASMRRQLLRTMVKSLPPKVQRRVKALKNLQLDYLKLESKFYEEVYQIERKYVELYKPIVEKRAKIITGNTEPTDEESKFQSADEEDEEVNEKLKQISLDFKKGLPKLDDNVNGIPDFWLTVFKSTEVLADMIQTHDEPILKELLDITIVHDTNDMAYTLEFHFKPNNEYFKESVLTKKYFVRSEIDKEEPFAFEGPEIYKCTGCVINWLPGKNVTVKTIKKKQKHKARGAVRTITKQVPNDSFFNFFNPPTVTDESKMDEESQAILATDFEIGHFMRARIIPKAVLYYTGDIVDEDDSDEEEEEEASEEETDQSDEEEERKPVANKKAQLTNTTGESQQPADCKQQ